MTYPGALDLSFQLFPSCANLFLFIYDLLVHLLLMCGIESLNMRLELLVVLTGATLLKDPLDVVNRISFWLILGVRNGFDPPKLIPVELE